MSFLWFRTRNAEGKSQLHQANLENFRITSPTLIYLSGFLTLDRLHGSIAGCIRRADTPAVAAYRQRLQTARVK